MNERGSWSLRLAIAGMALCLVGPLLAHFGLVPPMAGFLLFALGGLLGIGAVVAGLVALVRGGRGYAIGGLALGLVCTAMVLAPAMAASGLPRINDITTDVANPPVFRHAPNLPAHEGRDLSFPEPFGEIVRSSYPDLQPVVVPTSPTRVFETAVRVAEAQPTWELTRIDRERREIEGIATSRLFRFRDDFVIRVRPSPTGAIVDMRSKSRDGQGDLGANAHRIREFLGDLDL